MHRSRPTLVTLGAIVIVAVAACGGGATGDPTATVKEMVSLVESRQFAKIADIACAAEKQAVAEQFDFGTQLSGQLPGMDAAAITDTMTISMEPVTYSELERSADKAKVRMTGTMTIGVDTEKMKALLAKTLDAQGVPADDAMIGPAVDAMVTEFAQGQAIDSTVDLVFESGRWVVCGVTQGA